MKRQIVKKIFEVCNNNIYCNIRYYSSAITQEGPWQVYNQKLKEKLIKVDRHQEAVVKNLQNIYDEIKQYEKPSLQRAQGSGGIFQFFTSHNTPTKENSPKGIYIFGSVGGGKTMLMDLFYDTVPTKQKRRVHFNSFMLNVHTRIHELKMKSTKSTGFFSKDENAIFDPIPPVARDIAEESWLICFDEFQVTDIGDAMIIKRLFTQLFENGCIMIATSNRKPDDLYKNGLQRSNFVPFIPILKKHCYVMQLDSGIDYRMQTAEAGGQGTYFLNSSGPTQVDNLFKFMISKENDTVRPRTIHILGRNVKFEKSCGRILDTTFAELCDRALGATDYLILSKTFHTIFIRDLPQIHAIKHRSQARRFITLLDTLYDNRVRVVFAADVSPKELFVAGDKDELDDSDRKLMDDLDITKDSDNASAAIFTGEEEMFACDRCISRIVEMKSPAYWEKWDKEVS